jgi:hypothetical protein
MGRPWYINADDEAGALVERIVRPAYEDADGTTIPLKAEDISAATAALEYWDGSAWVEIAGTAVISDTGSNDSEDNDIYQIAFTRDADATAALTPGERYFRRWVLTWAGGAQLTVPERGRDTIVVHADPA